MVFARSLVLVVLGVSLSAGCDKSADAPAAPLGRETAPIVNGQTETGWPGVGALTVTYGFGGYSGSFCTGTLIAPRWVLTAGHCLAPDENGEVNTPSMVKFLVGNDANPNANGQPQNGTLYQSDAFYVHPQYNGQTLDNDVALLHLATAVPNATTYPVNSNFLNAAGETAFYVGYGATNGVNETGSGVKRSTSMEITWVYEDQFTSDYVNTGTCFGDSGGPVFLQFSGTWRIIGVNSAIEICNPNTDPGCNADPCKRSSIASRADVFAGWIASVTNGPAPVCTNNPSMCACATACQANGACDNTKCQIADCETTYDCLVACAEDDNACQITCYNAATASAQTLLDAVFRCGEAQCGSAADYGACMGEKCKTDVEACFPVGTGPASCREVYDCLIDCPDNDTACPNNCYETGTAQAQDELDAMLNCFDTKCNGLTGDAFQTCASDKCGAQIDTCFPTRTGDASCESLADCIVACPDNDDGCPFACFETGTSSAQAAYDDLASCADTQCKLLSGNAFSECLTTKCAAEYDTCFPPSNCAITGGECATGEACFPTLTGATDCFPSNGKSVGAGCNPSASKLDCGDGALCMEGSPSATCVELCRGAVDCGPGRACDPLDPDDPTFGTCACEDFDADEACANADCNDDDANIRPGTAEKCGDQIDNNCAGGVDEGCDACTDGDQDGYCTPDDCNDGDKNVSPGTSEICGDGVDNDCANGVDDGCDDPVEPGPEPVAETTPDSGPGEDATTVTTGNDATTGADTATVKPVGRKSDGCAGGGPEGAGLLGLAVLLAAWRRQRVDSAE